MKYAKLIETARNALQKAYAPYSAFRVGAALQAADGEVFTGCNIESSSYGLTVCAERVAIFKAISEGVMDFEAIVISAETDDFCPPCGACRQVLSDFAPDLKIVMVNNKGDSKESTISELLPEAFGSAFLTKKV